MKHLLPSVPYFKANLHSHSTISDGAYTKEELREIYKSRGYQILAITDHNLVIPHPELEDEDFLLITAYTCPEIEERIEELRRRGNTVHVHLLDKEVAA